MLENLFIYHLLIDRFHTNSPGRHAPYGRPDYNSKIGSFFGGDLSGVICRLNDGWFEKLGVNAILLSPPFEQIHGWIPGGEGKFEHFGYHGYFTHDYTTLDKSFGTNEELHDLIEIAHKKNISVFLDIAINHPGYPDLMTLANYGFGAVKSGWENATPLNYYDYLNKQHSSLNGWWNKDWVRSDLINCDKGGNDELTMTLFNLPDFKTESTHFVDLPLFLQNKSDSNTNQLSNATVADYLISWICSWIRNFGIDGIRCDSAKHVDMQTWRKLKIEASRALRSWKSIQGSELCSDDSFIMIGEVFGAGIDKTCYHEQAFDSTLNFSFQDDIKKNLSQVYEKYSVKLRQSGHHFVSYISSHDTYLHDRDALKEAAVALLMAPGGVLLYYGDETRRMPGIAQTGDPAQQTRSPMNWETVDVDLLEFWQRLGQFRQRHVSLSCGMHITITSEPNCFARFDDKSGDLVVVAISLDKAFDLPVDGLFFNGESLIDAMSLTRYLVANGVVRVGPADVILLERG